LTPLAAKAQATIKGRGPGTIAVPQTRAATPQATRLLPVPVLTPTTAPATSIIGLGMLKKTS